MYGINKKLRSVVDATSPEKMKELAEFCKKAAVTLRESSALMVQAGEAFDKSDFNTGCRLVKQATDALAKA